MKYFLYDTLTWPELDRIPRTTPLVIPLGFGFDYENLSGILGNPKVFGILPSFPYGWAKSGLIINNNILNIYLSNLLDSLQDDGFSRVFVLTPKGIDIQADKRNISLPIQNPNNQPIPYPPEGDQEKVVLIPIGHTEQHGFHLPFSTDTIIIDAICESIIQKRPDIATRIPTMPFGVSTHRKAFIGTLNSGGRIFEDFFINLIDCLVSRQFTRFYFLNGHGGNSSFLVNVVKYTGEKYPWIFCATSWLYLSGPKGVDSLEKHRRSKIGGMGHACELETALMLYLKPKLVHMDRVIDETSFIKTPSYYMDWIEGGALIANPPWEDDTKTGAYGAGSLATKENGKIWFEVAVIEKIGHVEEIQQQYKMRKNKRESTN